MKRILLIVLAVLAAASCKKVTPDQRIGEFSTYFSGKGSTHTEWMESHDASKRIDYLTLNLAKTAKADDLWTLEGGGGTSLIAEFTGRTKDKKGPEMTIISASLDDPVACGVVLDVMEAFRELKVQHKNTIRAVFYEPSADSTGLTGLGAVNREFRGSDELMVFDIELSSRDTLPSRTFVLDEQIYFARQLIEVLPTYFKSLGDFEFVQGTPPDRSNWPMKGPVYRYHVEPGNLDTEAAAVATLAYLLN